MMLRDDLHATLDTPLGTMLVSATAEGVSAARFLDDGGSAGGDREADPHDPMIDGVTPAAMVLRQALHELNEYFAGARHGFEVPCALDGTPFQRAVWDALRAIPYATTASYGELAARVGRPRAVRAVGGANNANRLAVIVPCHRVIGAGGALVGYGAGVARKAWLLRHEQEHAGQRPLPLVR